METRELLFTRKFTDLGPLQAPYVLQYFLVESAHTAGYGLAVRRVAGMENELRVFRGVCKTREQVSDLLLLLYENGIGPGSVEGVLDDLGKLVDAAGNCGRESL